MKTKKSTSFPKQKELLDLLKKEIPLHSVFVISTYKKKEEQKIYLSPSRTNPQLVITYTILIVSYKPISKRLGDFIDELYNKMQQRCKVYPITYSLSSVKKKMNTGNNFLARIMSQTVCMYKENETLSGFQNFQPSYNRAVYERIKFHWINRMERARYLLSIIDNDFKVEYTSKLATIHLALEQACLGLLYVFWEFTPIIMLCLIYCICVVISRIYPKPYFQQKPMGCTGCIICSVMPLISCALKAVKSFQNGCR